MKQNKYTYLIVLQGCYDGKWCDLTVERKDGPHYIDSKTKKRNTPYSRIRADLRAYRENEGGQYRIVHRRCLNEA